MLSEQERGFRGRFVRNEAAQEQVRLRAMAHLIGEAAIEVRPDGEGLTSAELRALIALAQGKPVKEIARTALAFSIPHLRKGPYTHIRQKLGARNMRHAVRIGFEEELIDPLLIGHSPLRQLSQTQKDVLELVSLGADNKDICEIMIIAPNTSTSHLTGIKQRYDVDTLEHATAVGIVAGDVPLRAAARIKNT